MKNIIISIRYSVISSQISKKWKAGRNVDFEEYKNKILNPRRLKIRRGTFSNITFKSLLKIINSKSDDVNIIVHVITSDLLPDVDREFLEDLKNTNNFLKIEYLKSENASYIDATSNMIAMLKDGEVYASVRLDDDDALSIPYLNKLSEFIDPAFNGMAISLCSGYQGLLTDDGEIINIQKRKWRFGSVGLAYIGVKKSGVNKNIYSLGTHISVDDKAPTILLSDADYFFRGINLENDSESKIDEKLLINDDDVVKVKNLFFV